MAVSGKASPLIFDKSVVAPFFPRPSNTFSKAFQKVLRGLPAKNSWPCAIKAME